MLLLQRVQLRLFFDRRQELIQEILPLVEGLTILLITQNEQIFIFIIFRFVYPFDCSYISNNQIKMYQILDSKIIYKLIGCFLLSFL